MTNEQNDFDIDSLIDKHSGKASNITLYNYPFENKEELLGLFLSSVFMAFRKSDYSSWIKEDLVKFVKYNKDVPEPVANLLFKGFFDLYSHFSDQLSGIELTQSHFLSYLCVLENVSSVAVDSSWRTTAPFFIKKELITHPKISESIIEGEIRGGDFEIIATIASGSTFGNGIFDLLWNIHQLFPEFPSIPENPYEPGISQFCTIRRLLSERGRIPRGKLLKMVKDWERGEKERCVNTYMLKTAIGYCYERIPFAIYDRLIKKHNDEAVLSGLIYHGYLNSHPPFNSVTNADIGLLCYELFSGMVQRIDDGSEAMQAHSQIVFDRLTSDAGWGKLTNIRKSQTMRLLNRK